MRSWKPKGLAGWLTVALFFWASASRAWASSLLPPVAVNAVQAQHASIQVVDLQSHRVATLGPKVYGLPGSVLKPLFLDYALRHGLVQPETTAVCHRSLSIAGRPLPCTHPADRTVFTAETALADSCNTWFAQLGERFTGAQLQSTYESFGLPSPPLSDLPRAERQLRVLGLAGPLISPRQLLHAYSLLFSQLAADGPVDRGLRGSVRYGMAHPAALSGVELLGKTGTASNPGEFRTHGWFAGGLPGRLLIVTYVPEGDGGSAARLARLILLTLLPGRTR